MINSILQKIQESEQNAKKEGFYWEKAEDIIEQVKSEILEVEQLIPQQKYNNKELNEEVGDLIHASLSLCCFLGFSLEATIEASLAKFARRFNSLKKLAIEQNKDINKLSHQESLKLWDEVKKIEKNY